MSKTTTAKCLIGAQYATTSATSAIYTVSADTQTIIDKFTATDVSGSGDTITVYIVPSGQSLANDYKLIVAKAVSANTCLDLTELKNHILNAGDKIHLAAANASRVVVRASGREVVTS